LERIGGPGLAALLDRPTALFYFVGFVAVLALVLSRLTAENRVGYRRGRSLSANEKIFLRTLDAALGRKYAHPVIMRSSRVQALHVPRRISGITLSLAKGSANVQDSLMPVGKKPSLPPNVSDGA
jgi:hypothetical protein